MASSRPGHDRCSAPILAPQQAAAAYNASPRSIKYSLFHAHTRARVRVSCHVPVHKLRKHPHACVFVIYISLPIAHGAQLSMTLFSIIGGFWLLDSLKDTVLEGTVGLEYQPRAKLVSVAVTLLLVIQYNRLVDSCSKPTVSAISCACGAEFCYIRRRSLSRSACHTYEAGFI